MMALMIGIGVPAAIALLVALMGLALRGGLHALEAIARNVRHELLMRPQNVYFRWECRG